MDGYFYMLIIFLLILKCSVYFCWYKARRERYLSSVQQHGTICVQHAEGHPVYLQNPQTTVYSNQGLVEQPTQRQYGNPIQDKPPAYDEISGINYKPPDNQPPPPTYQYATSYPATAGGPTNTGTVPYPQTTSEPTNQTALPYSQATTGQTTPTSVQFPQAPTANPTTFLPYPQSTNQTTVPHSFTAYGPTSPSSVYPPRISSSMSPTTG